MRIMGPIQTAAFLVVSLSTLSPPAGMAGELSGVTLPDQVAVEGRTLVLNGLGLREATFLKVDVYVAGLYLEKKSADPDAILASDQAKRLVMHFVRKVGREDLVKAWQEGFEKNAGQGMAALEDRIATLSACMSDMAIGDVMSFTEVPGQGVRVEVKGQDKGT
ncbi:MAG TPA: chalcone isomerase family protein, partial [Candidatus Polarisedimenticolia bacterium]|nr:chalcone isomerase family protein [Candidatus Polarisedimenticolia bacterium]